MSSQQNTKSGLSADAQRMAGKVARRLAKLERRRARKVAALRELREWTGLLRVPAKIKDWQPPTPTQAKANAADFLQSYEWRRVRMMALKKFGPVCQCCGDTPANGAVMNVDHIKPRSLFPQLALDVDNLQVLCGPCNHGKGNWDMTDWRAAIPDAQTIMADEAAIARFVREIAG